MVAWRLMMVLIGGAAGAAASGSVGAAGAAASGSVAPVALRTKTLKIRFRCYSLMPDRAWLNQSPIHASTNLLTLLYFCFL